MKYSIADTNPESYEFTGLFVIKGEGSVLDFRTKSIEHMVGIMSALASHYQRRMDEANEGGSSTSPHFECSIQSGSLVWNNEDGRSFKIEAAYDLRNWNADVNARRDQEDTR